MMAAKRGLVEMSEFLLSEEADVNIKDEHGKTICDMPLPEKTKTMFYNIKAGG